MSYTFKKKKLFNEEYILDTITLLYDWLLC